MDSSERQGFNKIQQQAQPVISRSPSDLKPPTIDSIIVSAQSQLMEQARSFISQRDSGSIIQIQRKSRTLNHTEEVEVKFIAEEESKQQKSMKGSQSIKGSMKGSIRSSKKYPVYFNGDYISLASGKKEDNTNFSKIVSKSRYVRKFIQKLMQQAYIFRQHLLTVLQVELLKEQYLQFSQTVELQTSKYILDPSDKISIIWCGIIVLTLLLQYIWLPLYVSFYCHTDKTFNIVALSIMFFDIIVNFNRAYIVQGTLIRDRTQIFKNYIQSSIVCDVLTFFAIMAITLYAVSLHSNLIITIILLIILYVCSMNKLKNYFIEIQSYYNAECSNSELINLLKLLLVIIGVSHISSCIWHQVGLQSENSWVFRQQMDQLNTSTQYLQSLYWSTQNLMTIGTIGYTNQYTDNELICSIIIMFIACGLLGYTINIIGISIQNLNHQAIKHKKIMKLVNKYLNNNNVSFDVRCRIKNYLKYYCDKDIETNEDQVLIYIIKMQEVIESLPENLKEELFLQIRGKAVKQCQVFTKFSDDTKEKISCSMETVRYSPDEIILEQGQFDDSALYIIQTGQVQVYEKNNDNMRIYSVLNEGQSFGEWGFFTGQQRKAFIKSLGFVKLYKILQQNFIRIVQCNQQDLEIFHQIKLQMMFYKSYRAIGINCFACNKTSHMVTSCPTIKYIPDIERAFKRDNFHDNQDRVEFIRSHTDKKKYRTLSKNGLIIDSIKAFCSKEGIELYDPYESYSDDESESDEDSYTENEDAISNNQSQKLTEIRQDGTVVSIVKQQDIIKEYSIHNMQSRVLQDLDQDNDELYIIRPNNQKGTISTAQFQQQGDIKIMVNSLAKKERMSNSEQKQQFSQTDINPIPSIKRIQQQQHLTFQQQQQNSLEDGQHVLTQQSIQLKKPLKNTFVTVDHRQRRLSKVREEESGTLDLSNSFPRSSEDNVVTTNKLSARQTSVTPGASQRPSMKRFSSKLSTIQRNQGQGTLTQGKSTYTPFSRSTMQLPTTNMVDLSMYKREDKQSVLDDIDRLQIYATFFPWNNVDNVVQSYNKLIKSKFYLKLQTLSKYTFNQLAKIKPKSMRQLLQKSTFSRQLKS